MPALALVEALDCGGSRASWSPEKHLPPGTVMCTWNWVWGPQKEHPRAPGDFFLYQKRYVWVCHCGWIQCATGDGSRFPMYPPSVKKVKPVEIAENQHCWEPSSLTAPLAASHCPARGAAGGSCSLLPVCRSRCSSPTQLHAAWGSLPGTNAPLVQKANHSCRDPEHKPSEVSEAQMTCCSTHGRYVPFPVHFPETCWVTMWLEVENIPSVM